MVWFIVCAWHYVFIVLYMILKGWIGQYQLGRLVGIDG